MLRGVAWLAVQLLNVDQVVLYGSNLCCCEYSAMGYKSS